MKAKNNIKRLKRWFKDLPSHWWGWLIISGLFLLTIQALFTKEAPIPFFDADWESGDLIAFAGTITLGFVAWQQNMRLLKLEEHSIISENACLAQLIGFKISGMNSNQCNLELHSEQILNDNCDILSPRNYSSFVCTVTLERVDNYPALVHVDRMLLFFNGEKEIVIDAKAIDNDHFTRISIGNNIVRFDITLIVPHEIKQAIQSIPRGQFCDISMELSLKLLTNKNVASNLLCRNTWCCDIFSEAATEKTEKANSRMCFWHGNEIISNDKLESKSK